ncbi:MAG: hypothetical protein IT211_15200 [Armatimonadetes bacterium]|nr:hypothetical protein [Armatimonadota bacterium]
MLNRILPYAGALMLALGVVVGCSENTVTEPTTATTTTDPYYVLRPDVSAMNDLSELPSLEALVAGSGELVTPNGTPPDTGVRPGGGKDGRDTGVKPPKDPRNPRDTGVKPPKDPRNPRDTGVKPPRDPRDTGVKPPKDPRNPRDTGVKPPRDPRDTGVKPPKDPRNPRDTGVKPPKGPGDYGRLNMETYSRIIKQLQLSREQDSAVRICFESYRRCVGDAAKTYGAARQALKKQLDAAMRELRSQPKGDARDAALKALRDKYIADVTAMNASYDAQVKECQTSFESCVASNLTPDQLTRWTTLLGTIKR